VSEGDGSLKNLLFRLFEGPKKSIWRKPIVFGFSGLFDFLSLGCPNKFSVRWSLFSLLFQHEYLAVGSGLAQRWYLMLGEPRQKWMAKTNRTECLIAGLHQSRMVHRSSICVLWG
jgi:hypothetical protein